MDLEQLTKHQIVLLTLLVSFVTSIATGIVTISLMDQAPASVTHSINQIVERTVEQVLPANAQGAAVATVKTVVVKNDDLTAQSIATVQKSIVRIVAKGGTDLVARGVIIDNKGTALTDRAALDASGADSFDAILSSGEWVPLKVRAVPNASSSPALAVIDIAVGTSTGFAPAVFADPSKLQLGQSVIRIGGKGQDTVAEGVVASLPQKDAPGDLEASVSSATPGSVLISLFGEVLGITTTDSLAQGSDFYTIPALPAAASSTSATK
jgi:hypothetical protein